MASIYAVKNSTGGSVIPVTDGQYTTDEMSLDFAACIIMVDFFSDAAGTVPATATSGTISIYHAVSGAVYDAEPSVISAAKVSAGTQRQVAIAGPVKRIKAVISGIAGAAYARISAWRSADYEATGIEGEPPLQPADPAGNVARNTVTQEQLVAQRNDHINVQFQYNVPYNQDSADINGTLTGTGAISHANSMAIVSSGAGVGNAVLTSRDSIRYFPGHEFAAEMTARVSALGGANTLQMWGIGDAGTSSGDCMVFCVQNGVFGAAIKSNGTLTFIPQSQFNRDKLDGTGPSGVVINPLLLNLWTFRGGWYGILPLQWGVYAGADNGYIVAHILDRTNTQNTPHLSNPTLPMLVQSIRTAGTGSALEIHSASWRGGICGPTPTRTKADRNQNISIDNKSITGGASPVPVVTLRNNATFQGKQNHVRVRYGTVALSVDGTKDVVWEIFKGGTLTGASFVAKNAATSVVDYDISATAYTPSTTNIGGTVMGKTSQTRINLFEGDVVLAVYPGETITLCARSPNNTVVSLFFRWIEEF